MPLDFSKILGVGGKIAGTIVGGYFGGPMGAKAGGAVSGAIGSKTGDLLNGMKGGNHNGGGKQQQSMGQQAGSMGQSLGFGQIMQGMQAKKEAQGFFPQYEDPRQVALLAEIQQKRKSLETGSAFANQIQNADQAQAATQNAIVKSTGGDVGGTIQGLLQSERNTSGARNQAYAQGQGQQLAYNQIYGGLLDNISARKLELQLARSQQKMAEWAQSVQNGNQNFLTGATRNLQQPNFAAQDTTAPPTNNINDIMNSGAKGVTDLPDGGQGLAPELTSIQTGIA